MRRHRGGESDDLAIHSTASIQPRCGGDRRLARSPRAIHRGLRPADQSGMLDIMAGLVTVPNVMQSG